MQLLSGVPPAHLHKAVEVQHRVLPLRDMTQALPHYKTKWETYDQTLWCTCFSICSHTCIPAHGSTWIQLNISALNQSNSFGKEKNATQQCYQVDETILIITTANHVTLYQGLTNFLHAIEPDRAATYNSFLSNTSLRLVDYSLGQHSV